MKSTLNREINRADFIHFQTQNPCGERFLMELSKSKTKKMFPKLLDWTLEKLEDEKQLFCSVFNGGLIIQTEDF